MADTTKFKITLTNVDVYDGDYVWDLDRPFNGHDLHLIKEVAKVRLGEIGEALGAGDYDVMVAITAIILCREGKVTRAQIPGVVETMMNLETGAIVFEEITEVEERPPTSATPPGSPSVSVAPSEGNGSSVTSLPVSNGTGAVLPASPPSPTGHLGWEDDAA